MKNVFYFRDLNSVGGIEAYFNYLANEYSNYDITIYYKNADYKQLNRLQKIVRCIRYTNQTIECDKAFFCFNREIWNNVKGKKYIVLHGDYEDMVKRGQLSIDNLPIEEDCDGYIGVSQSVCDSFERLTGIKPINLNNPFIKPTPKKILRLVYCGRLTKEKGGERVNKLLDELDKRNIDYQMFVYSNGTLGRTNVIQLPTRLDVANYLNRSNYDYLLQLSDNEGYCYSVVEALSNGLPIIKTPIKVFDELGLNESNSITLNYDCSNVEQVVEQMIQKDFNFTYTQPKDNWNSVLVKGKKTYRRETKDMKVKVQVNGITNEEGKPLPIGFIKEVEDNETIRNYIANGWLEEVKEEKVVKEPKVEDAKQEPKEVKKAVRKTTKKK